MTEDPHVLLLGNSVFMDSVAESLLTHKRSIVTRINVGITDVSDYLLSFQPDLIIYELNQYSHAQIFALISEETEVSHLAIDLKNKLVFLYHCKCEPTGSMNDLCDFVSSEVSFLQEKKKKLESELVEWE